MTYNITINIKVTDEDVMDIMCSAIEGGIGYWACLDNTTKEFEDAPKDEPYSETCAKILLNGGGVWLMDDVDDDVKYLLSLERLLVGIENWFKSGGDKYGAVCIDGTLDCGNIDAECADAIIQYALFDDVVYG